MNALQKLKEMFVGEDEEIIQEDEEFEAAQAAYEARRRAAKEAERQREYDDVEYTSYKEKKPVQTNFSVNDSVNRGVKMEQPKTLQIVLARPNDFSEVKSIGDDINAQKTVLLNLETVKSEDAKRILDFISGVAYANGANIKMMAQKTFAIMAKNVEFSGIDLMTELENNGYNF